MGAISTFTTKKYSALWLRKCLKLDILIGMLLGNISVSPDGKLEHNNSQIFRDEDLLSYVLLQYNTVLLLYRCQGLLSQCYPALKGAM